MEVAGLVKGPQFNGRRVIIQRKIEDTGRFLSQLIGDGLQCHSPIAPSSHIPIVTYGMGLWALILWHGPIGAHRPVGLSVHRPIALSAYGVGPWAYGMNLWAYGVGLWAYGPMTWADGPMAWAYGPVPWADGPMARSKGQRLIPLGSSSMWQQ